MIRSFRRPSRRACLASLMLAACAAPARRRARQRAAREAKVGIDNFSFTPETLTVNAGTTSSFENHDDIPHLVVGVGGIFRSKALDTNDKFSFTFDKPGEYAYFCGLHPYMKGKIVVAP